MSQQELLDQIAADIKKNNVCPDLAKSATNLVLGDGNPNADIVFIGEAPGKNEDLQGLPFVGAAGKFLNEMLESVGLVRGDIYITNIVKYRPPNNRDPLPDEKKAFWPYLVKQLAIIKPKVIITLGRHSMEYFLPGAKITAVHGQPKRMKVILHTAPVSSEETPSAAKAASVHRESEVSSEDTASVNQAEWVILPLYHPAAALYNGGLRQTLLDDFAIIPTLLKKLKKIS